MNTTDASGRDRNGEIRPFRPRGGERPHPGFRRGKTPFTPFGICVSCDAPLTARYAHYMVCHNCFGTTDDPWFPRNLQTRLPSPEMVMETRDGGSDGR